MAEPRKRMGRWGRFLLIWTAALLLLGLIGCGVLYGYLDAYEQGRPEPVMERLLETSSARELLNAARENPDFSVTPFEDGAALYQRWLEGLDLSGKLSCSPLRKDSDGDRAVYVVRCGASKLCQVTLKPGEQRLGFGQHDWVLDRISTGDITSSLSSVEVEITALADQTVLLNGIALYNSWAVETDLPLEGLNPVEARSANAPRATRYRVGPLYGEISVQDAEGRELAPLSAGKTLVYDAIPAQRQRVSISAPADVTVLLGDVPLEAGDAKSEDAGLLTGLESYTGSAGYQTRTYELEGLLRRPEVRALDAAGTELAPVLAGEDRWVFLHAGQPEAEGLRPVAERFFQAYMTYLSSTFSAARYDQLLNLTLPGTELYTYFETSVDTMYWAIHTSTEFRDLEYDNFYPIGEDCFVCTIRYDAGVSGSTWVDAYSHEDQNTYELVFVRAGERWLAAAMSSISG